jgi:hypothetical protein
VPISTMAHSSETSLAFTNAPRVFSKIRPKLRKLSERRYIPLGLTNKSLRLAGKEQINSLYM